MDVSEWILSSTIRIETEVPEGISTGTGFFFKFLIEGEEDKNIPVIVTNKHVIKDAIMGKLRFSIMCEGGKRNYSEFFDLNLENFENLWITHPDPYIDLCILPIAFIHKYLENEKKKLFYSSLSMSDIPSTVELKSDFSPIEEIMIVGYPNGIWDESNNMPIVRKGITATSLQLDFNNRPIFYVDAAIYGGSSGSPIYVCNQGSFSVPNRGLVIGSRLKLVGIIFAVAQHTVNGDIKIIKAPVTQNMVAVTNIPNNLGVAIHARKLKEFEGILKQRLNSVTN